MQTSKITLLSNKWHYLALLVVLVSLSFVSQLVLIILLIYLYFLYKNTDIFLIALSLTIISFSFIITNTQNTSSINIEQTTFEVKVIDFTKKTNSYELIVRYQKEDILVRYNKVFEYNSGDILIIEGILNKPNDASFLGDFDYQNYLRNKGIYYILTATNIEKTGSTFHINRYKNNLLKYFEDKFSEETYSYISSLVFANKVFETNLNQSINTIGLSYLFAISGMHIILMFNFIKKILKKLIFDEQLVTKITLGGLFIYTLLLQSTSVNRAFLMLLLAFISKKYKLHLTKLDVLSISLIMLFIYKPLSIYEVSFILSFLVTFVLILVSNIIGDKSIVKQLYKISLLSFVVSLPIVINMNNQINLITIMFSPILALLYSLIILPITYISLFIPIDIFSPFFNIFNQLIIMTSNIDIFVYNYRFIEVEYILIYYVLLFILLKAIYLKKDIFYKVSGLIVLIILFNNVRLVTPYTKVSFIDTGQGDSTYIELAYNKGNIMIDSYGKNVDYLKTIGVNSLDYLIITHNDLDHTKTLSALLTTVKVKNIVINGYNHINDYDVNGNYNIIYVKADDVLTIGNIDFNIINPIKEYSTDNNLSIGLYFEVGLKFLLTGDMEREAETEAINKYGEILKADVYKAGHHGSNTSSTLEFVNYVDPKYSIISAGLNNRYNFPHNQVLTNLKNSQIFITFKTGNIDFYCYSNKYRVETFK